MFLYGWDRWGMMSLWYWFGVKGFDDGDVAFVDFCNWVG